MICAYLQIEGKEKKVLEEFRRVHDSLYGKIEAHITVLFPNSELELNDIVSSIKSINELCGFDIELSKELTYENGVGYIKVSKGAPLISAIYQYFNESFNLESEYIFVPHVTVVRGAGVKPLNIPLNTCNFRVVGIAVEKIIENEIGKVVYQQQM